MKNKIGKYTYRIMWSEDDQCHIARCLEFPSLSAHGNTAEETLKEIEFVVTETIKWMEEEGEMVPEPFGLKNFKINQGYNHPFIKKGSLETMGGNINYADLRILL